MKNILTGLLLCISIALAENQPALNLIPTTEFITVGNTMANSISKWSDTRKQIEFEQSDPILQPSLLNFNGANVVGFLPKSYLNNKFLVSRFTYPSSRIYISSLLSIFNRPGINTTAPFTILLQEQQAITLQYEYDTKCLGFYWCDRGVQLCDDKLTTEVGSTNNVVLVFASLEGKVLSLQVGDALIQRHVDEDFDGIEGSIVLGGSTQVHSPFFGLFHNFKIYSEPLSDFVKYSTAVQLSWKYNMNLGSWDCWHHDENYSQNVVGIYSYSGESSTAADSSSYLHVEEIDALATSSAVPASLCLAHNAVQTVEWKEDEAVAGMYWLNQSWKFKYTPGSAGAGQVKLRVKNLPSIHINGSSALCYKEAQNSACSFILGGSSFDFLLSPKSGYYSVVVLPCNNTLSCATLVLHQPSQVPADSVSIETASFIQSQLHTLVALIVLVISILGFVAFRIIRRRKSASYSQVIVLEELDN